MKGYSVKRKTHEKYIFRPLRRRNPALDMQENMRVHIFDVEKKIAEMWGENPDPSRLETLEEVREWVKTNAETTLAEAWSQMLEDGGFTIEEFRDEIQYHCNHWF